MAERTDAPAALARIAFLLERAQAPTYRVRAFRRAAGVLDGLADEEIRQRVEAGTLQRLEGIGPRTAEVVREAVGGAVPRYLARLEEERAAEPPLPGPVQELRRALRGDLHLHSDWSDGGSPPMAMAQAAAGIGHDWAALTDHSPRLTVAHGLSPERLRQQLAVVAGINAELAPFRLLTGIECDILDDGRLDQEPELLAELDVVVASVHSGLRTGRAAMTRRMVAAVRNPLVDVLGHCTGRLLPSEQVDGGRGGERGRRGSGKGRPESEFDAAEVFAACAEEGVAVEINSRPERLDPPRRLLRQAVAAGVLFALDTDAHAPGQLDWQPAGCARAVECGVARERIVNTWYVDQLLAWTHRGR